MSKHLRTDLERLERLVLSLAGRVERALRTAISALLQRQAQLAEEVVAGDTEIDRMEVEIEEECLKALALHQPVASDLRFVAACLKVNSDLERIGDLAANIAERARSLARMDPIPIPREFEVALETVTAMVRESIAAFIAGDAAAARGICEQDDRVDEANRRIIDELLEAMHADPEKIDRGMLLFSVSKALERIADHTTNIAEDVVYIVEGDIIRHRALESGRLPGVSDASRG